MKSNCFSFLVIFCSIFSLSYAVVDYQNGNYFQEFVDLNVPYRAGSIEFKRSYNSVSSFEGMFGKGWGSSFEVRMQFVENAIIITEMGNGRHHIYIPEKETLDSALKSTLALAQKKNNLKGEAFKNFKERMLLDPQIITEYSEFKKSPNILKYKNLNNPYLTLNVDQNGIDYFDSVGNRWLIDSQGQLKKWSPRYGGNFEAKYKDGLLDSLLSKELYIQFIYDLKKVKEVKIGPEKAFYIVKDEGLVKSRDQNSTEYNYDYDQRRLVALRGPDINETITYDFKTGSVKSVKNLEDEIFYNYSLKTQPNLLKKTEVRSKKIGNHIFEYEYKVGQEGPYLHRRKMNKNNVITETIYDECCGRPLQIKDSKGEVQVKYLENGLPTYLKSPQGEEYSWEWQGDSLIKFTAPNEVRNYEYQKGRPIRIQSKIWGELTLKYSGEDIVEANLINGDKSGQSFKFMSKGQENTLITHDGKKAFLVKTKSNTWAFDPKRASSPEAKMQLFVWLKVQEQLLIAPKVDEIIRSF